VLLMDEPFSAVDPVVRANLQDELLRLQSELGKTILFVTHDIDEAIKLGDKVAVLRTGGVLAQYDEPSALLARPADKFVEEFVGRDRGYRGLGFLSADGLPIGELATVPLGTPAATAREIIGGGWAVVVDSDQRPQGWVRVGQLADGPVTADSLIAGGSLYDTESGSLRGALDSALSSPSGLGVAVDANGGVVGSVSADDVLAVLEDARHSEVMT
jgi:osmoprotectant transport system ATP-binding protein